MTPWQITLLIMVLIALIVMSLCVMLARRLNRLHSNVLKARLVAEQALAARARYASEAARSGELDIAGALILTERAETCLDNSMVPIVSEGLEELYDADALSGARRNNSEITPAEAAAATAQRRNLESELSRTLRLTVGELDPADIAPEHQDTFAKLERARLDVRMTRKFHNSQVAQARHLHKLWLVRLFRLAGRAPMPQTIDIDDE
ncbi:hypothetical protein SAMN05421878_10531 [Actinobaculum suis]|uniref:NUDIX hydrolase n=1 Tax=Actinobaculum suis TaxID=1657 RepID=A0A1G7BJN3_9ACTO|nr:hypothetical protein [Actinobaculum suis]MDY5153746.1 hypothetical protein [Actinobaculum suis]SDE27328.1 hypothetical protein SAMN05421878_10531 [Actinobaculum suis]